MSLISKRLVGIVASTALLSLVSMAAHAQVFSNQYGTWYTNRQTWQDLVTNVSTADYVSGTQAQIVVENGVTAKGGSSILNFVTPGFLRQSTGDTITFTFSGNAFSGEFQMLSGNGVTNFSVDNSLTNIHSLATKPSSNTFIGYISNSASPISVKVSQNNTVSSGRFKVDSFSFGQSTSSLGGNVAPEPGSFALALTGGAALIGICVRRRWNAG